MVRFSDVLTIVNGRNQKNVENKNGQYPIYGSGGIMGYADKYLCEADTVIIGRKGSINNPIYVKEPFWNVDTAFGLVADKTVLLPKYLYYFCVKFDFNALNTTVTIPSLTKANLLNIEMVLPTIEEQTIVVNSLDKIVNIIDMRKQQLQKLDELVKARFVEMFGDVINNPALPMVELKNIAYIGSSKRIYASEYSESGIPFYRSKEIRELGLGEKPSTELYITEERYVDIKKKFGIPKLGDILIAAIGATIGYSWVVDTEEPFYYKDGNIINISVKSEVNCVFLNYVLQVLIADYKTKGAAGSAQLALTIEKLEKMKVVYPDISLQNQFTDFVQQIDKSKLSVQNSLNKLEMLKKALMQKYFG